MSAHLPRALTEPDAEPISVLHALCFEAGWPSADMKTHILRDIGFAVDGVVNSNGCETIAGFILLRAVLDQAEVLTLAVHPAARKTGIARALLSRAEHHLDQSGVTSLFLEVAEDNAAALALYKSMGYDPIGRRPNYYRRAGGRVAALNLAKRLSHL